MNYQNNSMQPRLFISSVDIATLFDKAYHSKDVLVRQHYQRLYEAELQRRQKQVINNDAILYQKGNDNK